MSDVTLLLSKIEAGDPKASEQLLPLVYNELRKLAAARMSAERPDHTLQATALVHEAFLRLVDVEQAQHWDSRGHFFSAAAEAMRRILVDSARRKRSLKRGGDLERVDIDEDVQQTIASVPNNLIELSDALERLAEEDGRAAELVKLRLFAGLSVVEAGELLGMAKSTAYENWDFARVWFTAWLDESVS
jgi:RNA polymerase sigma factor (TIGR02999 family)